MHPGVLSKMHKTGRPTWLLGKLNQLLSFVVSMVHENICPKEPPNHMKNLDMQKLK